MTVLLEFVNLFFFFFVEQILVVVGFHTLNIMLMSLVQWAKQNDKMCFELALTGLNDSVSFFFCGFNVSLPTS